MNFTEKKRIKKEIEEYTNETFELIENNELAKELWKLCNISDNLALTGEEFEEEYLNYRKEFYETFINFVKKYEKK